MALTLNVAGSAKATDIGCINYALSCDRRDFLDLDLALGLDCLCAAASAF